MSRGSQWLLSVRVASPGFSQAGRGSCEGGKQWCAECHCLSKAADDLIHRHYQTYLTHSRASLGSPEVQKHELRPSEAMRGSSVLAG